MKDIALTLYSLLVIWGIGLLLIRRFRLFGGQFPSLVYGAAIGIGGGVLSLMLLLASGVTGRLSVLPGYVLLLVAGLLGVRSRLEETVADAVASRERPVGALEILLIGVVGSIALAIAVSGSFGSLAGDGWAIWGFKAKVFFVTHRVDLAFLRDEPRYGFAHLDYPLLLPLIEFWVYGHLGHVNESVVRLVHVAYYLSLLAVFYGSLRTYAARAVVLVCTIVLALLGPAVIHSLAGYADVIQGYYMLLAFVSFVAWVRFEQFNALASAGISVALGSQVKAEGLSWLAAMTTAVVLASWCVRRDSLGPSRTILAWLVFTVPVSAVWPLYRWVVGIPVTPVVDLQPIEVLLSRVPIMLEALRSEFGVHGIWQQGWGLLWGFVLLGCVRAVTCSGPEKKLVITCWLPVIFQGVAVLTVYLLITAPLKWQLTTSLTRILLQLSFCCLWASAASLLPNDPFLPRTAGGVRE